jgi:hypothetical protein
MLCAEQDPSHFTLAEQVKGNVRSSAHDLKTKDARIQRALELIQQSHPVPVGDVGLGIGVGILLAPASGEETRSSIAEKVQDVGERVRDRFSLEVRKPATGTLEK